MHRGLRGCCRESQADEDLGGDELVRLRAGSALPLPFTQESVLYQVAPNSTGTPPSCPFDAPDLRTNEPNRTSAHHRPSPSVLVLPPPPFSPILAAYYRDPYPPGPQGQGGYIDPYPPQGPPTPDGPEFAPYKSTDRFAQDDYVGQDSSGARDIYPPKRGMKEGGEKHSFEGGARTVTRGSIAAQVSTAARLEEGRESADARDRWRRKGRSQKRRD